MNSIDTSIQRINWNQQKRLLLIDQSKAKRLLIELNNRNPERLSQKKARYTFSRLYIKYSHTEGMLSRSWNTASIV